MRKIIVACIVIAFAFGAISCSKTCVCKGTEIRTIMTTVDTTYIEKPIHIDVGQKSKSACEAFLYESTQLPDSVKDTVTNNVVCSLEK